MPAPERLPVECWQPIQSGSERAFEFMAKYGISGVIGGGSAEGGAVERHMIGFQQAYARRGVRLNWASGWRSATSSTSPPPASRRSAKPPRTTKRT